MSGVHRFPVDFAPPAVVVPDHGFSLFEGDPVDCIYAFLGLHRGRVLRFALFLLAVVAATWGVEALLSLRDGLAGRLPASKLFLRDFSAIAQVLAGIPLLLLAERFVDGRIHRAVDELHESGLVPEERRTALDVITQRIARWRRSRALTAGALVLAYVSTWFWLAEELTNGTETWHAVFRVAGDPSSGERLTLAGAWAGFVCVPLFLFLLYRWAWKLVLWCAFLYLVSRLELVLLPIHPDRSGGLGFLGRVQADFSILIFAVGVIVAATALYKHGVEGQTELSAVALSQVLSYCVFAPVAFLLPLLPFSGRLAATKQDALFAFNRHGQALSAELGRHMGAPSEDPDTSLLAVPDFSTFTDFRACFDHVASMRIVPFDLLSVGKLVLSALGPMIPVLGKVVPLPPALKQLLDVL